MLIDGFTLAEGSSAQNFSVATGTTFPAASTGEMFYRTDVGNIGLYVYNGTTWALSATNDAVIADISTISGSISTHIADQTVHLTSAQNTWIDAITASSAEVNHLVGATSDIQTQLNAKQATLGYTPYNASNPSAFISSITSTNVTTALGYTPVNKAGDSLTGALILAADPTQALGAVTKQYADNIAAGLNVHLESETATTSPLASCAYYNGVNGVGATLTANAVGSIGVIGGYGGVVQGTRLLVKDQAATLQNGIYTVTAAGSGSTPWVLTRTADFDNSPVGEITAGAFTYIQEGSLAGTQWVVTTIDTVAVGTTGIVFGQLSGASTVTAGTGITVVGNVVSNAGVTSLVAGTNIAVSGGTGTVTVSVNGTVPAATTATNVAGGVAGSLPYQTAAGATALLAPGSNSQVLTLAGGVPTWANPAAGSSTAAVAKFSIVGTAIVGVMPARWYPNRNITVSAVYFSAGTGPTGSAVVDVLMDGASIFPAGKPTCTSGAHTSNTVQITQAVTTTDYLTISVMNASSMADVTVCIIYT